MAPYLYYILREEEALEQLPETARRRLAAAYGQTAGYHLLALEAARFWSRQFAGAGLDAIWFKGLPLSLTVYPEPAVRPMVDIDVLLPQNQAPTALKLVESLSGCEPAMFDFEQTIHAVFNVGPAALTKMELHWSLIAPKGSMLAPGMEWFLEQKSVVTNQDFPLLTFTPEAHLLYLCAHAELSHGEAQFRLLRYLDIHLLISSTPEMQWDRLLQAAVACRWTYAVERALTIAKEQFGAELPRNLLVDLEKFRPVEEDISFVLHLQQTGNRWQRTQQRLRSLPREQQLRMLAGLIAPPRRYIRWRYNVRQEWKLPLYYPYRWLDAAAEVALALKDGAVSKIGRNKSQL